MPFKDCGDILPPQPSISAPLKPESAQDVGHKLHAIPSEYTQKGHSDTAVQQQELLLLCGSSIMGKEPTTCSASFA